MYYNCLGRSYIDLKDQTQSSEGVKKKKEILGILTTAILIFVM